MCHTDSYPDYKAHHVPDDGDIRTDELIWGGDKSFIRVDASDLGRLVRRQCIAGRTAGFKSCRRQNKMCASRFPPRNIRSGCVTLGGSMAILMNRLCDTESELEG